MAAKYGRKGAGIQGGISFGPRHGARKPPQAAEDLGIREVISTDAVTQVVSEVGYDLQNKELIVTKSPVGGGGGGGGDIIATAIVYGGNTSETAAPYPAYKPFIFALDRFPRPKDPAKAVDWTKLDLPLTFAHGNAIPAAPGTTAYTWPKGVGLARLTRGSPNVGSSAWNADLDPVGPLSTVAARPHYFFTKRGSNPTELYCYFDKASISAADAAKITMNFEYSITDATVSGPVLTLTVSPPISGQHVAEGLIVTFLSESLVVCENADTGGPVYLAPQAVNVSMIDNDTPVDVPDVAIRGAVIEPAALNQIKVWMSGPVSNTASAAEWSVTGGETALSITAAAVTSTTGGILSLTLNRAVTAADLSTAIEVSHTAAITTQTLEQTASPDNIPTGPCAAGGPTAAVYKAARDCYVLVVNRYTERDYRLNDIIDISPTSFVDIEDENGLIRRAYDSRIREIRATPPHRVLAVIGGNGTLIGSNIEIEGIQYATGAIIPDAAYDPNTTTEYPAGLGRGILYEEGIPLGNVLIRHDFTGFRAPVLAGMLLRPCGTETLTYDPGDGSDPVIMIAHRFDWV